MAAKLKQLGWDSFFEKSFNDLADNSLFCARVMRREKKYFFVIAEQGDLTVTLPGTMYKKGIIPAVGDWVALDYDERNNATTIRALLARKNKFSRKVSGNLTREQVIAANLDYVFLITALDSDFSLRRLERYLALACSAETTPVIILNKTDLCPDADKYLAQVKAIAAEIAVHPICALAGTGLDALKPYLTPGNTVSFLGSSGVGKSTLVNRLLGFEHMKTKSLRQGLDKGSHTTSHRELILIPGGAVVIDSPGMRELQLWGETQDLKGAFARIESLASGCRFRDCRHLSEPDCAITAAVKDGDLTTKQLDNYFNMKEELKRLAGKQSGLARYEGGRRGKQFSKMIRQAKRKSPKKKK